MLSKIIPSDSSCYTDSEKLNLSTTYRFGVIEENVKGQDYDSTGVKHVKCFNFADNGLKMLFLILLIQLKVRIVCYMQYVSLPWLWSENVNVH